jgi:hypothetical protein
MILGILSRFVNGFPLFHFEHSIEKSKYNY